jgi:hypothetical protein
VAKIAFFNRRIFTGKPQFISSVGSQAMHEDNRFAYTFIEIDDLDPPR